MNDDEKVTLTLELDQNVAWALAQFCKRTSHQDCAERSTSEDEAYLIPLCADWLSPGLIPDN